MIIRKLFISWYPNILADPPHEVIYVKNGEDHTYCNGSGQMDNGGEGGCDGGGGGGDDGGGVLHFF